VSERAKGHLGLIVASLALLLSMGGVVFSAGTLSNRVTQIEQKVQGHEGDHDLLVKLANDVEWIKRAMEKQGIKP
jgi:hypothetical protein